MRGLPRSIRHSHSSLLSLPFRESFGVCIFRVIRLLIPVLVHGILLRTMEVSALSFQAYIRPGDGEEERRSGKQRFALWTCSSLTMAEDNFCREKLDVPYTILCLTGSS